MEIIYKNKKTVAYKMIPIGSVFSCCDTLYISTQEVLSAGTGELSNAVSLDVGGFAYFDDNYEVTPVKAQVIIS